MESPAFTSTTAERRLRAVHPDVGAVAVGSVDVDSGQAVWRTPADQRAELDRAFVLLREGGWPLGIDVCALVDGELAAPVGADLVGDRAPSRARSTTERVPLTVVVCTRQRPDSLQHALQRIVALEPAPAEVIVVDNAPQDDATAAVVDSFGGAVRRVVEEVPGLSRARNCGLAAVNTPYVAFTDDDVDPDPAWVDVLAATFAATPGTVCVSGAVLPASLTTRAELLFAMIGGYGTDVAERDYHLSVDPRPSALFPFHPKLLGTGANMAFRTEALLGLRGFDTALGAGTPARGGEDIDIAVRLLHAGHLLVRQPAAVLWHPSPSTEEGLRRQMRDYGCGLAAAFTKFASHRGTNTAMVGRMAAGMGYLLSPSSPRRRDRADGFPGALTRAEWAGLAEGPVAYLSAVRLRRRLDRQQAG
jgi:glycosyltransferase involved in cell wall biosynthesis